MLNPSADLFLERLFKNVISQNIVVWMEFLQLTYRTVFPILTRLFLNGWKTSPVQPVPKKSLKFLPANYCLIPIVSKLNNMMEKVTRKHTNQIMMIWMDFDIRSQERIDYRYLILEFNTKFFWTNIIFTQFSCNWCRCSPKFCNVRASTLFLAYINDFLFSISTSIHRYADNCTLHASLWYTRSLITTGLDYMCRFCQIFNERFWKVLEWFYKILSLFNASKTRGGSPTSNHCWHNQGSFQKFISELQKYEKASDTIILRICLLFDFYYESKW